VIDVMNMQPKRHERLPFERRIYLMALLTGLPGTVGTVVLIWVYGDSLHLKVTVAVFVALFWLICAAALRENIVFPLRTVSNLLAALREGDFSFRARGSHRDDALTEVMTQVNHMADTLRDQRSSALEATALLRKVMAEIDVAIFAFDATENLRLINRAGEKLLNQPAERVMGLTASELALSDLLVGDGASSVRKTFPGGSGVWNIRRGEFREHGAPHWLLVISDLTRVLRQEELLAWQRLVRVLGHEINNSLTPVKSISESLAQMLTHDPLPEDWREDASRGLEIISARSAALNRFTGAYARLARHPAPVLQALNVSEWVQRNAVLETRLPVIIEPGELITIPGDPDQLDQLLINLIRNAADATPPNGGKITVTWKSKPDLLELSVVDEGSGIANPANLFIPFFTTKPHGSGIGLVLSRQIAEAHGGSLTLTNRTDRGGSIAILILPRR
jgi:nitrogen fixation/metabolism regulation signal transduction histidine kinase